jgi:hypothetical protein
MKALLHFKFEVPDSQLFLLYLEPSADVCNILYRHHPEGTD